MALRLFVLDFYCSQGLSELQLANAPASNAALERPVLTFSFNRRANRPKPNFDLLLYHGLDTTATLASS